MRTMILLLCLTAAASACAPAAAAGQSRVLVPIAATGAAVAPPPASPFVTRPSGTTLPLHGVAASGPAAWAVGDLGRIIATRDGGATWRTQSADQLSLWLYGAVAVSDQVVWAVGANGLQSAILATRDGGATWLRQEVGTSGSLRAVAAASPTTAWAVGDEGTIVATTDGGLTWRRQQSGTPAPLQGVAALSPTTAVAAGWEGLILGTTDGGAHWTVRARVPPPVATAGSETRFYALSFATPAVGWAVGIEVSMPSPDTAPTLDSPDLSRPIIYATRDGGATWTRQDAPTRRDLYSVAAVSPTEAWAGGFAGELLVTRDGGTSWVEVAGGSGANFEGMTVSQGTLWGVGDQTIRSGPTAAQR